MQNEQKMLLHNTHSMRLSWCEITSKWQRVRWTTWNQNVSFDFVVSEHWVIRDTKRVLVGVILNMHPKMSRNENKEAVGRPKSKPELYCHPRSKWVRFAFGSVRYIRCDTATIDSMEPHYKSTQRTWCSYRTFHCTPCYTIPLFALITKFNWIRIIRGTHTIIMCYEWSVSRCASAHISPIIFVSIHCSISSARPPPFRLPSPQCLLSVCNYSHDCRHLPLLAYIF